MPDTPIWFYLARRHRLAYLQVPKVASTSLRAALCLLNHPELSREQVFDLDQLLGHDEWNDKMRAENANLRGFFRFTFVRDPYARFTSFHRNKIAQVAPAEFRPRFKKMGLSAGMSLDQVLDGVEAIPPHELDPHIVPQSHLVYAGDEPRADFIGRIERFAEDLAHIEREGGVRLDVPQLNKTEASPDPRETLRPEQRERLSRLYRQDLARFGYEP